MRCIYGIGASSAAAKPSSRPSWLMILPRSGHPDLDHLGGRLQSRLDTGPRGRTALRDPGIPDLVHLVNGANVLQPDRRLQELRLVGAGLGEEPVNGGKDRSEERRVGKECRSRW